MRISNNMSVNNYLRNLNNTTARQYLLQQQLGDGKALHRPSDDPIKTVRSLTFNSSLRANTKLTESNRDALSWMNNSDTAMNDMSTIMIRIKELVVQAGNPNPDMSQNAIGNQIDTLINELVTLGNSKVGNRYLFAGQSDQIQPFRRETVNGQDTVVYYGDLNKIAMRIQTGAVDPYQDSVGLNGAELFGPLTAVNLSSSTGSGGAMSVVSYPTPPLTKASFEVNITGVDANGMITGAEYRIAGSTDPWTPAGVDAATGVITLGDGVKVQFAPDADNTVGAVRTVNVTTECKATCDVFSTLIRIKDVLAGMPSPTSNTTVTLPSTVTGTGATTATYPMGANDAYNIQIDGVTGTHVTSIQYQKAGASTWTTVNIDPENKFVLSDGAILEIADDPLNVLGTSFTLAPPSMGGYPSTGVTAEYEVQIPAGGINGSGQVTQVQYRKVGDTDWTPPLPFNPTDPTGKPGTDGKILLPDGVYLQIPDNSVEVGATFAVTAYPGCGTRMVDGNSVSFVNYEGLAQVDAAHDSLLVSYTRLGARMSFYDMMENIFAENDLQLSDDISKNEDLDLARALIDFQTNENIYRTSLAIGARIMPPSLVDFL